MPRGPRLVAPNLVLHVMARGNNRMEVFKEAADYRRYLFLLRLYKEEHRFLLYHYCLMPNHVHLIVKVTEDTELARMMKQINLSYMHYYKGKYGYWGHFWQGRYKSIVVSTDEHILACGKYIENNPVRAGLVDTPKEYEYSSYNHYASGKKSAIIDDNPIFAIIGGDEERNREYYKSRGQETCAIDLTKRVIGGEEFLGEIRRLFGRASVTKRPRGRPRKAEK